MTPFDHYLYVLECADGSLYTGYTTNIQARISAHQSGKGAKYTRNRGPYRLAAQARFYSKERAMSAEARFKQLNRYQKDEIIALSEDRPLEEVLCERLPDFGKDTAAEFVCRALAENMDAAYKDFNSKLIPSVENKTIVGVRTPALRKIAKELAKRDDVDSFMNALPHRLFEENQIHAFTIGFEKDYETALKRYDLFLPYVDNWATCDQLPVKILAKQPKKTLIKVEQWLGSDHCYTIRFAIGILMRLFLTDNFETRFPAMIAQTRMPNSTEKPTNADDIYYVDMMRAWYFAEALAKQQSVVLPYFKPDNNSPLDEWTRRKAIQKAIESRRISTELKDLLRSYR